MLGDPTEVHPVISYSSENHDWQEDSEEVFGYRKDAAGQWEALIGWKD